MSKSIPPSFHSRLSALLGPDEACSLCTAILETEPVVSVRQNPMKYGDADFAAHFPDGEPVPWCECGRYLSRRPSFIADPLLHAGCYYVQEAASMFLAHAISALPEPPRRVLDLCAAPGGKSTLWRSLLPDGALLVANEPIRQRAQVLNENIAKWGHPDTVVTNAYPEAFAALGGFFDAIGADVPCSGEGMFRKDETAVAEWSEANVINCAERQWNIICDVWPALRRGGYLVYSTCTYNREENEDNVLRICHELGAEPVPLQVPKSWNIVGDTTGRNLPVYHFFPHRTRGEGLFLALLRKTADAPEMKMAKAKGRSKGANNRRVSEAPCGAATVASWLADADDFRILPTEDGRLIAVRSHVSDAVLKVRAVVPTLSAGILLAESKGAKFIPQHPLALSDQLSHTAFPRVEIDLPTALAYLRREAITLPPEVPRSYVVLTHGGHPLGFANNIGTRANNMYPQEWRIRKEL